MKMITAIVRTTSLDNMVKSLEDTGIREMTISEIKGIGEETPLFKPYTMHSRIDIIVPDEKADKIADVILRHAHAGLPGDGLIAVHPVDYMIKIRTKEKFR
jgi:nitrogen regulatory protein PII